MSKRKLYKCDDKFCWNDCEGEIKKCIRKSEYVQNIRKDLLKKRYNKHDLKSRKELIKKRLVDIDS